MSYFIIKADLVVHKHEILRFWEKNFVQVNEKRYAWIYENNISGKPLVFLLRHTKHGEAIGGISLFPRILYIDKKPFKAYVCGDLVVDQEHRFLGPAMKLIKAAIDQCEIKDDTILYGFPNAVSEKVFLKAGFEVLDHIHELTCVIRTYPYIRKFIPNNYLTHLFSWPMDQFFHLRYNRQHKNVSIEIYSTIHGQFDVLWKNMINDFSFIGERNRDYINWRFSLSHKNNYRLFTIADAITKNLSGYILYQNNDRRIQIDDIGFRDNDQTITTLVNSFYNCQRKEGKEAISINIAGNPALMSLFKKSGYSLRSKNRKLIYYPSDKNKALIERSKEGMWYFTTGDNDI